MLSGCRGGLLGGVLGWSVDPDGVGQIEDLRCVGGAESVRVFTVQGRGGDEIYTSHDADICEHLRHYQLPVSCEKLNSGDLSVGDLLLSRCADEGIDLLVMGAFAQTRRGHQTLGEVGSQLLRTMTVPVLMSH